MLPDEDSNLDKQNQNLSYCLYTIGQNAPSFRVVTKIRYFGKGFAEKTPGFTSSVRRHQIIIFLPFLNQDVFIMEQQTVIHQELHRFNFFTVDAYPALLNHFPGFALTGKN